MKKLIAIVCLVCLCFATSACQNTPTPTPKPYAISVFEEYIDTLNFSFGGDFKQQLKDLGYDAYFSKEYYSETGDECELLTNKFDTYFYASYTRKINDGIVTEIIYFSPKILVPELPLPGNIKVDMTCDELLCALQLDEICSEESLYGNKLPTRIIKYNGSTFDFVYPDYYGSSVQPRLVYSDIKPATDANGNVRMTSEVSLNPVFKTNSLCPIIVTLTKSYPVENNKADN